MDLLPLPNSGILNMCICVQSQTDIFVII